MAALQSLVKRQGASANLKGFGPENPPCCRHRTLGGSRTPFFAGGRAGVLRRPTGDRPRNNRAGAIISLWRAWGP